MPIIKIEDMIAGLRPNKVLNLISITLITLMIIFACKLIIHLFSSNVTPSSDEITTILASCMAINIVAYLILRKHQLLVSNLTHCLDMKGASFRHANNNLRHEIAAHKRFEADLASLQRSEEKYRLLVTQIPAIVFKGYVDWTVDFYDDRIETITGYKKDDFNSKKIKWSDVIIGEDLNEVKRQFMEALKDNKRYVREYRIKDIGVKVIWIEERAEIFCDKDGRVDYISGFFDIPESKEA